MKKRTFRRICSLFLTVLILLSALPLSAMAVEIQENSTVTISTVKALEDFLRSLSGGEHYKDQTVRLTADLDLSELVLPVQSTDTECYFAGHFDGEGHTLSNLTINAKGGAQGLFGPLSNGAVIQNLTIENVTLTGPDTPASDLAIISPTVSNFEPLAVTSALLHNVAITGRIQSGKNAAGENVLMNNVGTMVGSVGQNGRLILSNCRADTDIFVGHAVSGDQGRPENIGGMVGSSAGQVTLLGSLFEGSVTSSFSTKNGKGYVGGLIGKNAGTAVIRNSAMTGEVSYADMGFILGGMIGGSIKGSGTNTVEISSSVFAGKLFLGDHEDSDRAGGMIGMLQEGTLAVNDCLIAGSIAAGTAKSYYSISPIVPSVHTLTPTSITLQNSLISTDLSQAGAWANVFTGMRNGGTTDALTSAAEIINPVCKNVYYIPDEIGTASLTAGLDNAGNRANFEIAPAGAQEWTNACTASTLGEAWAENGDFVKYPLPQKAVALTEELFYTPQDDGLFLRVVGKQERPAKKGDGYADIRFIVLVSGEEARFTEELALGINVNIIYNGELQNEFSHTVNKGYRTIRNDQNILSAESLGGNFFITLTFSDVSTKQATGLEIQTMSYITQKENEIKAQAAPKSFTITERTVDFRVMSFNVQRDLNKWSNVISKENRMAAVLQQVLDYSPDMVGFQEDDTWWEFFNKELENYTLYDAEKASGENRIYIKNQLASHVVDQFHFPLTEGSNRVALTYRELTDPASPYYMTPDDLAFLKIYNNTDLITIRSTYNQYTNAEHTAYAVADRKESWSPLATGRNVNCVVLEFGGQHIIYANTHLQYRNQNNGYNGYYDEFDKNNLLSPVQTIRSLERQKCIAIFQKYIEELKIIYPGAEVVVTGDMNDWQKTPLHGINPTTSRMYRAFTETYGYIDTMWEADRLGVRFGGLGSMNSAASTQDESKMSLDGSRLDYCFISQGLTVLRHENSDGYAEINGKKYFTSDHRPVVADLRLLYK